MLAIRGYFRVIFLSATYFEKKKMFVNNKEKYIE